MNAHYYIIYQGCGNMVQLLLSVLNDQLWRNYNSTGMVDGGTRSSRNQRPLETPHKASHYLGNLWRENSNG